MRPLKFTLEIEHKEDERFKTLMRSAADLEKVNYSVERFTGENGETTTVTFESSWSDNLKCVADLVHSILDEIPEAPVEDE